MNRRGNLDEAHEVFKYAAHARAMAFGYELIKDPRARAVNETEKEKS
jgi:hypothetical protein